MIVLQGNKVLSIHGVFDMDEVKRDSRILSNVDFMRKYDFVYEVREEKEMIKLLLGGSPCTFWSIAQSKNRETKAEGQGWELFKNFLIAKEKFQPDFFLYENNWSASKAIKEQIQEELGCELMRINSNLVSAQNRDRFYVFNWDVDQPEDRWIMLRDVLETGEPWREKSYCVTATEYKGSTPEQTITKHRRTMVAERVGTLPKSDGTVSESKGYRSRKDEKGKTSSDLRAVTVKKDNCLTTVQTDSMVAVPKDGATSDKDGNVYMVKDGYITIKDKKYPINLEDGNYTIRKLTSVECERLQTMPDGYTAAVSNTQRYRGLGNGWTAEVIIHILQGALKDIPKDEKIVVLSMYDGIGTGRYCLDKMGFTNIEYHAYEIDKFAIKVAMSNYPDIIQHGDAFDIRKEDWDL